MDRLFGTKTLVLSLDLVEDGAKLAGKGASGNDAHQRRGSNTRAD